MKILFNLFTLFIFILFLLTSCSKEISDNSIIGSHPASLEYNNNEAEKLAREGIDVLNTKILDIEEIDIENVNEANDIFSLEDYNLIKSIFVRALEKDPTNALANLGMAIVEVFSVNYDNELWDIVNDFDNKLSKKALHKNQMHFISETPKYYLRYLANPLDASSISLARLQNYIDDNVLPKLNNSLGYLENAITFTDIVMIDDDEEERELDRGEIYMFRATVYVTIAAMKILTLYDVDLYDAKGTYDWLDDLDFDSDDDDDDDYWSMKEYRTEIIDGKKYLIQYYEDDDDCSGDSLLVSVFKHNLHNRDNFLKFKQGKSPASIKADLENALVDLQNTVDYVTAEGDDQSDDIIKMSDITEMNDDLSDPRPDDPEFTQEWKTVDDVIDWLETMLNSPYTITEKDISFQLDISKFFSPGISDLEEKLPLHRWINEDEWVTIDSTVRSKNNWGKTVWFWINDEEVMIENVDYVAEIRYEYDFNPIDWIDEDGKVVRKIDEVYFPDYTIGGIFPDMTRPKMVDLFWEWIYD